MCVYLGKEGREHVFYRENGEEMANDCKNGMGEFGG
jgi:hypothetical protein